MSVPSNDPIFENSGWLGRLYLSIHKRNYQKRLARQATFPDKRIISLGNLSAGGTGKTPLGQHLLQVAVDRGYSAAVLLRGYGGRASKSGGLVFDGHRSLMGSSESGDEAQLYRISGARTIIGRDRVDSIRRFAADCNFLILDDCFQNPTVRRDLDIVLIDATVPVNRARLLPLGRFREPLEALQRASCVILSRADQDSQGALDWHRAIQHRFPELPIIQASHEAGPVSPPLPAGSRVLAVSGIGNPAGFERSLQEAGFGLADRIRYSDHHSFTMKEILGWQRGLPVVTTEKDLVRIDDALKAYYGAKKPIRIKGLHTLPVRMAPDGLEKIVFGK
ncbi:MAG: tetraacyldisaccharide 4'-kinase [Leptospiraceae bacterium]|nr:tetraacyldisaccharide 4'-kinase [Leptospiraceae bacterium]